MTEAYRNPFLKDPIQDRNQSVDKQDIMRPVGDEVKKALGLMARKLGKPGITSQAPTPKVK